LKPKESVVIHQQALRILALREHSRYELQNKLIKKGWNKSQIEPVLDELSQDGLQSDTRFIESYIRYRRQAGYGPRRIAMELAERGIKETPPDLENENQEEWLALLNQAWQKKFNNQKPKDIKAKAKQSRFLIYRGFSPQQVHLFLNQIRGPGYAS